MKGLLESNGETSHKRVINMLASICAVLLTIGGAGLAIWKGDDLGTNTVILITSLWTISAGGAILSNVVEKK